MAVLNVAELKAATAPTHERGNIPEVLANRYVDEIEEALWYGGGARFGQAGCPQVLLEDMAVESVVVANAQASAETLEYDIPTDLLKMRVVRFDGSLMKFDTNWATSPNRSNVYKILNGKLTIPIDYLYPEGTAPTIKLEYYRRFISLKVAPNIISERHSNIYINGFISLVLSAADRPDKAAEYWEQFTTSANHINKTRHQSAYVGNEVRRFGIGNRGVPV